MKRESRGAATTGWVYRSDAAPALVQPLPGDPASRPPAYTAPTRVEMRTVEPARQQRGLIEMGLYVMALPMALSVGFMLAPIVAPMIWMFGPPSRR